MAKRANIGEAVAKLILKRHDGRFDIGRCGETIALSLEASGDAAGAATVREASTMSAKAVHHLLPPDNGPLAWLAPADSGELVLGGATKAALERLVAELQAAPRFLAAGIDAPMRVLFDGPSGTGKTLCGRWIAGKLGLPLALVMLDRVVSSYLGETAKKLRECFDAVDRAGPAVIFLDEIDGICGDRRGSQQDVKESSRVTSSLLQQIDLLPPGQIVIAATNYPDAVDGALVRRLPVRISFTLPDQEERAEMLRRWWARVPQDGDAIRDAADATSGWSGAGLRAVAMGAARSALLDGGTITWRHVAIGLGRAAEQEDVVDG